MRNLPWFFKFLALFLHLFDWNFEFRWFFSFFLKHLRRFNKLLLLRWWDRSAVVMIAANHWSWASNFGSLRFSRWVKIEAFSRTIDGHSKISKFDSTSFDFHSTFAPLIRYRGWVFLYLLEIQNLLIFPYSIASKEFCSVVQNGELLWEEVKYAFWISRSIVSLNSIDFSALLSFRYSESIDWLISTLYRSFHIVFESSVSSFLPLFWESLFSSFVFFDQSVVFIH